MFDYNPWELESSASTGNCVLLDLKGFWNRTKCTDVAEGAICYTSSKSKTYCFLRIYAELLFHMLALSLINIRASARWLLPQRTGLWL